MKMKDLKDSSAIEELFDKDNEGPMVLFAGQDILRNYDAEDYFLSACKARFGQDELSYKDIMSGKLGDSDAVSGILHNISTRIAPSDRLQKLARLPWNAVVSGSFHEVLERSMEVPWRSIDVVFNEQRSPGNSRSKIKLHVFKLFGCVTSDRSVEQPALGVMDLMQRNGVVATMLSRVPSLVTPKGLLVIDSLTMDEWDGFQATLIPAIAKLGLRQTHLFAPPMELLEVNEVGYLVDMNKLVVHEQTFGDYVDSISESKYAELISEHGEWKDGYAFSYPSGRTHTFEPAEWRRLTRGLTVLHDDDVKKIQHFESLDEKYQAFRSFLSGKGGVPDWSAYSSDLVFRRGEFKELEDETISQLSKPRLRSEPILICGQSGIGKSVALADLAVTVRKKGWPVIYFGRSQTDFDFGLIETVCTEIEKIEKTSILLVLDSNYSDVANLKNLAGYLASRGRKVVIAGAAYKRFDSAKCIEFTPRMAPKEMEWFLSFLGTFDSEIPKSFANLTKTNNSFWAFLWRLLPETRGKLRSGLLVELEKSEQHLQNILNDSHSTPSVATGAFGKLLAEAGIVTSQTDATSTLDIKSATGEAAEQVESLSGLILIPGRYGNDVPVDLVLRCLGNEGFQVIQDALKNVDLYDWIPDDKNGEHLIGARQQLEAMAVVKSRFSRKEEFEFIKLLISKVRVGSNWRSRSSEVDFVLRMLRSVGPDSDFISPSSEELILLAGTIANLLSDSGGKSNPWLLFFESHLRREAMLRAKSHFDWQDADAIKGQIETFCEQYKLASNALANAEAQFAEHSSADPKKSGKSLSQVHTEFASLYGLMQEVHLRLGEKQPDSESYATISQTIEGGFEEAIRHCKWAASHDSENANPNDVRFRVTKIQIENTKDISSEDRANLVSDLCDILDHESWRHSKVQFEKRRLELADQLEDKALEEQALKSLANMGSSAGEYLLAWKKMFFADRTWKDNDEIASAIERIEQFPSPDLRLCRLYTQAWWQLYGNADLFQYEKERTTAALTKPQWEHYLEWLNKRLSFSFEGSLQAKFSRAWALFQVGLYRDSEDKFRELDRESIIGRNRVIKISTWCDEFGKPVPCKGTIRRVYFDQDAGYVYVPQIRREVKFRPSDYSSATIAPNETLEDFYIAFNFRGPLCDPIKFYVPSGMKGKSNAPA